MSSTITMVYMRRLIFRRTCVIPVCMNLCCTCILSYSSSVSKIDLCVDTENLPHLPWLRSSLAKPAATSRLLMAIRASNKTVPVACFDFFCFHLNRMLRAAVSLSLPSFKRFRKSLEKPSLSANRTQCLSFGR